MATTGVYPLKAGPAYNAYLLARELNRSGIGVYMFIRADKKTFATLKESKELKELNRTKLIPIDINYNLGTFLNTPFVFRRIIEANKKFKEILSDVDLIVYNSPPVDITFCFPFISRRESKKQVFIVHGGLFNEGKNVIGKFLIYLQRNWFDRVIAVSAHTRDILTKFGFNTNKIWIIRNGIDLELFDNLPSLTLTGSPKILFVGPLRPIKGVDTLIQAFSILVKQFQNAHLYIVGDGPERQNLEQLVDSLHIKNNLHFEGFIPPGREVYCYYKSCGLLVMTSYRENFPWVLLEAMVSKIPVISSNIEGGPRELIKQGENGFLFPPGDYNELAKEMAKILNNGSLREKFTSKNDLLVKNCTCEKMARRYLKVFEELLL